MNCIAAAAGGKQRQSLFEEASRAAAKQPLLDFVLKCHQAAVQFVSFSKLPNVLVEVRVQILK